MRRVIAGVGTQANEDRSLRLPFRPLGAIRTLEPNPLPSIPTWVALHGWGSSPRAFLPLCHPAETGATPGFRGVEDGATPRFRGAVLWGAELFGHGNVGVASGFPESIEALAASLPPPPRYLVAYSFGARLGLAAWAVHPDLWLGATLIGVHPGLLDAQSREARRRLDMERAAALRSQGVERFFAEWDRQPLFGDRPPQPRMREGHDAPALARALVCTSLADMPDLHATLRSRSGSGQVRLLVGERDVKFRRLLEPFGARVVEGCAHDVLTEQPDVVLEHALCHASSLT